MNPEDCLCGYFEDILVLKVKDCPVHGENAPQEVEARVLGWLW